MFLTQEIGGRKIRDFSLSDSFIAEYIGKQPNWGPVGYFTYKRTYARDLDDGTTEEFWQTCKRVVEGVYNIQKQHCKTLRLPWNDRKAQGSAQEMFQRMWDFKFTPPGRGLWAMGTDIIYSKGSAALNNCAFVTTENLDIDFAAPFCFLMDMSMLGVGVGSDCRGTGKIKLCKPKTTPDTYVVEDSREGWIYLVETILNSFVGKTSYPLDIDYSEIRSRGTIIKGFGGVASGPEPLVELITNLTNLLMPSGEPQPITSAQIVDVFNYVGKCVVSGGVRRTAEIMFGEATDKEFIALKQDKEALLDRRWASNNSIFATHGMDYTQISSSIAKNGEPGCIWLDNMRRYGRMADPPNGKDLRVMGSNPCSEQSLEDHELCCLVETFPAHHDNLEDYKRTLKFAYLYAKTVTLVPTHNQKTNAVMMRNRRIGCSMSGIVQATAKLGKYQFLNWCDSGYQYIRNLDLIYSEWLCVPRSIKMTSVKPSGTVSLLCGATPGIHYPEAEYYIRNIRVANTSPLVASAITAGYLVEPDTYSPDTSVVSFPVKEKYFVKGKKDVTIWEQFMNAVDMQHWWADNQVSITVTFNKKEEKDINTCLETFQTQLKSISLLPISEHGYEQAPYIPITKEEYEAMIKNIHSMDLSVSRHEAEDKFCDGEACQINPYNAETQYEN